VAETETLIGLAEVALALAGFVAVVMVLATRDGSPDPDTAATVRVMISSSIGSAFACLIALAVLSFDIPAARVWLLSSLLSLIGAVGISAANHYQVLRHLPREDGWSFRGWFWWGLAVSGALIHLLNILGLWGGPSFALFVLGTVVFLAQCGSQFVYTMAKLLGRPTP
jgi:hypothetical protein